MQDGTTYIPLAPGGVNLTNKQQVNPMMEKELFEYFFSIYGDHNRAATAAAQVLQYYQNQPTTMSQGQNIGLVEGMLKKDLAGENAYASKLREAGMGRIASQARRDNEKIKETIDPSLLRSGVGANAYIESGANRQQAETELEANVAGITQQSRDNAIARLLGIDELRMNAYNTDRGFMENATRGYMGGMREGKTPFNWGDLIGGALAVGSKFIKP